MFEESLPRPHGPPIINKPVRGSAARGAGLGGIGGPCTSSSSARAPNYNMTGFSSGWSSLRRNRPRRSLCRRSSLRRSKLKNNPVGLFRRDGPYPRGTCRLCDCRRCSIGTPSSADAIMPIGPIQIKGKRTLPPRFRHGSQARRFTTTAGLPRQEGPAPGDRQPFHPTARVNDIRMAHGL
jgi:hypothetical protein